MAMLDGQFNILRIMIASTNDDEVFESPGDEEFAIFEKAEITGAEKGAFPALSQTRAEDVLGCLRPVPVSSRHARARDQNLANTVWWTFAQRLRIGNHY